MAIINGTNTDDTINGTSSTDTIYGLNGNDVINGLGGNDKLYGGDGNDDIFGGLGNDTLYGDNGNDYMYDMDGTNTFNGGVGDEYMEGRGKFFGGADNDTIIAFGKSTANGDAGDDTITLNNGQSIANGGDGNDYIYDLNTAGNNTLNGGNGDDYISTAKATINAGSGDDEIYGSGTILGESGSDVINTDNISTVNSGDGDDFIYDFNALGNSNLSGGNGNDELYSNYGAKLTGNAGVDKLHGASGYEDTFIYTTLSDSTIATPDIIYNFDVDLDTIQISNSIAANFASLNVQDTGSKTIITANSNFYLEIEETGLSVNDFAFV